MQKKIQQANGFVVGCGALGCEYLKALGLMGFSNLTVSDPDTIVLSNLHRQFLYDSESLSEHKSVTAVSKVARRVLPKEQSKNMVALTEAFTEKSYYGTFSEEFWKKQSFVISALDSHETRRLVNEYCSLSNVPMINSGTYYIKGNGEIYTPGSMAYEHQSFDQTTSMLGYLNCTLKGKPTRSEHCIIYAKEIFNDIFYRVPYLLHLENDHLHEKSQEVRGFLTSKIHEEDNDWMKSFVAKRIVEYVEDRFGKSLPKFSAAQTQLALENSKLAQNAVKLFTAVFSDKNQVAPQVFDTVCCFSIVHYI